MLLPPEPVSVRAAALPAPEGLDGAMFADFMAAQLQPAREGIAAFPAVVYTGPALGVLHAHMPRVQVVVSGDVAALYTTVLLLCVIFPVVPFHCLRCREQFVAAGTRDMWTHSLSALRRV